PRVPRPLQPRGPRRPRGRGASAWDVQRPAQRLQAPVRAPLKPPPKEAARRTQEVHMTLIERIRFRLHMLWLGLTMKPIAGADGEGEGGGEPEPQPQPAGEE